MNSSLLCRSTLLLALAAGAASAQSERVHLPVGGARGSAVEATTPATRIVLPSAVAVRSGGYTQSFDDIETLPAEGWSIQNNSEAPGSASWFQGNGDDPDIFPAYEGDPNAYIGVNFNSTAASLIYNWLITPEVALENGTTMSFWTRTITSSAFPDRIQVRLSTSGASVDVGASPGEEGDFTNVLLSINESLQQGGYPDVWTQYEVTVSGLAAPTSGRFAFLYFVEDGGPVGANSNYIGIDEVVISSGIVAGEAGPDGSSVSLSAGAPNPVASLTTLSYSLDAPAAVSVDVVDALGRTVATLASGTAAAGTHPVTWDARSAAPGVYVVRLTAGSVLRTQRVVVAR